MRSSSFPILLSLVAAIFGAVANWLFKRAALQFVETPVYKNWALGLGLILFLSVLVLFMMAFRAGGRLTVIYPAYATTYIWALALAFLIDREVISPLQLAGIAAIMFGVALIGLGARA